MTYVPRLSFMGEQKNSPMDEERLVHHGQVKFSFPPIAVESKKKSTEHTAEDLAAAVSVERNLWSSLRYTQEFFRSMPKRASS
mmetsp:Transcript_44614/g.173047  ORF Transcript_44614/g.173047 Transcript_44614/m.173047 type:complete len:83 (-) Transcript_44614:1037-1285(-)